MKITIHLLLFASTIFILQNCAREEEQLQPGKIQFGFSLHHGSDGGSRKASELPAGSSLRISVTSSSNEEVYQLEKVKLYKSGDTFISEPVSFSPGDYHLVDFLIVSSSEEVLFATPKSGSDMADLVERPLPLNFSVSNSQVSDLTIEVVDVTASQPEDFGYVSFEVEVVKPTFDVSAFAADEGTTSFTSAEMFLIQGGDTVNHVQLRPEVNAVPYPDDRDAAISIAIIKHGYAAYRRSFTSFNALISELDGKPLSVSLAPAFTMATFLWAPGYRPDLEIEENETITLWVDWGDGSPVEKIMTDETLFTLAHDYQGTPGPGGYFVSITGELSKIKSLFLKGGFSGMDVSALPELQKIENDYYVMMPPTIDLSSNPKLEYVKLYYAELEYLDLSQNPKIRHVNVGANEFNETAVNNLIDDVYEHAVNNNTYNGFIQILPDRFNAEEYPMPLPSAEGIEKLIKLAGTYAWTVVGLPELGIDFRIDPAVNPGRIGQVDLEMSASSAPLWVNWGDGSPLQHISLEGTKTTLTHAYPTAGKFEARIWHNRDQHIVGISPSAYEHIDMSWQLGLKYFAQGTLKPVPTTLYFTFNYSLKTIDVRNSSVKNIELLDPNEYFNYANSLHIESINLAGNPGTTSSVDHIIEQVHFHATTNNLRNRTLILTEDLHGSPDSELIAQPSPDKLEMLRELRDSYGWNIPGVF